MSPCRMAMLAGSIALACSSCADPERPAPQIRNVEIRRAVPEAAKEPCSRPVDLPDRRMTAAEVTSFWGRDIASLLECEERRKAAVEGRD